jgi:hypothetical protein
MTGPGEVSQTKNAENKISGQVKKSKREATTRSPMNLEAKTQEGMESWILSEQRWSRQGAISAFMKTPNIDEKRKRAFGE